MRKDLSLLRSVTCQNKQHQEPEIGNCECELNSLRSWKIQKCLCKLKLSHFFLDLSENGSRVYCAGEPLSPEQLRKARQLYFLPNVVFTPTGKSRFKPLTVWDQLFMSIVHPLRSHAGKEQNYSSYLLFISGFTSEIQIADSRYPVAKFWMGGYSWLRHRIFVPAYVAWRAGTTTPSRSQPYPPRQGIWIWVQYNLVEIYSKHLARKNRGRRNSSPIFSQDGHWTILLLTKLISSIYFYTWNQKMCKKHNKNFETGYRYNFRKFTNFMRSISGNIHLRNQWGNSCWFSRKMSILSSVTLPLNRVSYMYIINIYHYFLFLFSDYVFFIQVMVFSFRLYRYIFISH